MAASEQSVSKYNTKCYAQPFELWVVRKYFFRYVGCVVSMTNKPASAAARAGPSVRCWRGSALCSAGRNRPASGWSASGWRCGRCGAAQGARPVLQVRPRPRPGGCLAGAWPRTGGALPGTAQPVERAVGSVGATGRGDGCAAGQAHGAGAAFPAGTRPFRRPPVAPDVITVEVWHAAARACARGPDRWADPQDHGQYSPAHG